MKNIFSLLFLILILNSCSNKVDVKPETRDTLNLIPPAALDTMQLQIRPADSLLKTNRY